MSLLAEGTLETRRRPSAGALSGPVFACGLILLLIHSQIWVRPLFGDAPDAASGGLIRLMNLPAYALALLVGVSAAPQLLWGFVRQPFLVALFGLCGMSVLWSIAPDETQRRMVALMGTSLGGLALGARYGWRSLSGLLGWTMGILVIVSFLVSLLMPSIGVMPELFPGAWRGLWLEKNALGGNMAFAFVLLSAAAILEPARRVVFGALAVLAVLLVVLSTSKTALVCVLLGGCVIGFVWVMRRGPVVGVAALWCAVVVAAACAYVVVSGAEEVLGALGKDATLTGRTEIWAAIMRRIAERPWTGYGYSAVWDDRSAWAPLARIIKETGFTPGHAHNSWLEQWLGLGLGGLCLFGLFYLQTLARAALQVVRSPGAYLCAPFLAVYTLMTLTESVALSYNDFRWVIFLALATGLALDGLRNRNPDLEDNA